MLTVILKILSVLGMILLAGVGIVLVVILLVLFVPVRYRIDACKSPENYRIAGKASWLLGFLRVRAGFPEPGKITAKVLFFTLYDSSRQKDKMEDSGTKRTEKKKTKKEEKVKEKKKEERKEEEKEKKEDREKDQDERPEKKGADSVEASDMCNTDTAEKESSEGEPGAFDEEAGDVKTAENTGEKSGFTFFEKINEKIEKFRFSVLNIYGRIKDVSKEVGFYKKMLEDDITRNLMGHIFVRIKKILKAIRPRKLKASVVFGAGTPDVTGYVFGGYCMILPSLGKHVVLTPDFEEKRLEGELYAAGHITLFRLLVQALLILLDRNLKIVRRRLKRHSGRKKG